MKITQKLTREQMRSSRKDLKRIKSNRHPKFFQFSMMHIKQMRQFQFFLRNYWNKNHIFVKNKKFLLWQYKDGSFLSYVIAKLENKIIGIQGYIPQSHYDRKLPKNEIFLTISRSLNYATPGFLIKVLKFIEKKLSVKFICTFGFNEAMINYHKRLGFTLGYMDHYFAISPFVKKYKIIKSKKKLKTLIKSNNCNFIEIDEKFLKKNKLSHLFNHQYPKKSNIFIINRYLKHPILKYNVFLLKKYSKPQAIIVIRKVDVAKTSALRIIDFIGKQNKFSNIGKLIIHLFKKYNSEYIDIYSHGINVKYMKKVGLVDRKKINNLILPDYLSPIIRENFNFVYGYLCKNKKVDKIRILKGDGDRDLPQVKFINALQKKNN